jgi:hypothetical protein
MNAPALNQVPSHSQEVLGAIETYQDAKAQLDQAKAVFANAEKDLIAIVGHKEEGSFTTQIDDLFKVTTTGKVTRKLIPESLEKIRKDIPAPLLERLIRTEERLNVRELKFIQNNEPEFYRFLSPAIESKPGKPGVKVELIDAS